MQRMRMLVALLASFIVETVVSMGLNLKKQNSQAQMQEWDRLSCPPSVPTLIFCVSFPPVEATLIADGQTFRQLRHIPLQLLSANYTKNCTSMRMSNVSALMAGNVNLELQQDTDYFSYVNYDEEHACSLTELTSVLADIFASALMMRFYLAVFEGELKEDLSAVYARGGSLGKGTRIAYPEWAERAHSFIEQHDIRNLHILHLFATLDLQNPLQSTLNSSEAAFLDANLPLCRFWPHSVAFIGAGGFMDSTSGAVAFWSIVGTMLAGGVACIVIYKVIVHMHKRHDDGDVTADDFESDADLEQPEAEIAV